MKYRDRFTIGIILGYILLNVLHIRKVVQPDADPFILGSYLVIGGLLLLIWIFDNDKS